MWFDTDFGVNNAGIATVGYRQVNNVGGDAVARTTTGVVDAGNGMYGADFALNAATVSLQWDTGTAFPIFAVESVNQFTILDDKVDIIDTNVDLILVDTTALLVDVAALNAQNVLILSDTNQILLDSTQLLLDVAAVKADTAQILLDTTQLLLDTTQLLTDTTTIIAQNMAILADTLQILTDVAAVKADTAQILLDVATVDGVVDQILLDTTQLLVDTIAILSDSNAILLDTANINTLLSDIEDGRDIREILRLVVASAMNILSGAEAGSTQIRLRKLNGTGTRQLTNVDDDGNRLSIVSRDFGP